MLGPIEFRADGERRELGSRKERHLLAILLYEQGHPVSASTLVRLIWGDEPSDRAAELLHQNVSRLRRRLREAGGTGQELLKRPGGYELRVSRPEVDIFRFRDLMNQARAVSESDDERAFALSSTADALWYGVPLDGLDGEWAEGVRSRLNEERLLASVQRFRAGLSLGRHADLVGEIAGLARKQPPNETLLELLLMALYGAGRRAEALAAFHEATHRWQQESGSDLGPALRNLHRLMLHDDPVLRGPILTRSALSSKASSSTGIAGAAPPSTMPRDDPDFTGRAAELAALTSWLDSDRARSSVPVVVISGMAGVGKTAFAVHAAHQLQERYPGQVFVSLHANKAAKEPPKPAAALGTLLRWLDGPDGVVTADAEDRAMLWRYKIAGKNAVIVLDDALDAEQVLPLLPGTPGCLVLVTTRRRTLSLPGMLSLRLDPMPHADATTLFARAAGANAGEAANRLSVSQVVRLCGHVPQRIHLAGCQLRRHPAWSVTDLASRLRDAGAGERDMTAAFDLSYRYLTDGQQRLFRLLALHPGDSFSVQAAVAMANDVNAVATELGLEVLLDYHLIEERVTGRYMFHSLLREYAAERASAADTEHDRQLALGRLLDYYVGLVSYADQIVHPFGRLVAVPDAAARQAEPPMTTRRQCMQRLEAEKSSLLAVARYASTAGWPEHAGLLAHLLGRFLDTWGDWPDAIDLHRRAFDAWHAIGNVAAEAVSLVDLSFMLCRTGQHLEAAQQVREALARARVVADTACEAAALNTMGIIYAWSDQYEQALTCHDQSLARWQEVGDRHGQADALSHGVLPEERLGRHQEAVRRAELALVAYRELGDRQGESNVLNNLGGLQQDAGCYDEALASYERAMARFREIGDRQGEAIALSNIAEIRRLAGSYDNALKNYRTALSQFFDIGDQRFGAATFNGMAETFADMGDHQAALEHHEKALAIAVELADRHVQASSHLGIGRSHAATGHCLSAVDDFRIALRLSEEISDPMQQAHALHGLGSALVDAQGVATARVHWQAALAIFQAARRPEADEVRARLAAFPES